METVGELADAIYWAAVAVPERRTSAAVQIISQLTSLATWVWADDISDQRQEIQDQLDYGTFPWFGLALYSENETMLGDNSSPVLTQYDFFIGEPGREVNPCRFASRPGTESDAMLLTGHNCDQYPFGW